MRCWLVERITDAGEMAWVERPDPVPGPDEYVVRVEAAGVNFAETLMARGLYQRSPETPFSPGIEVAGAIGAAGDKTAEKPGRLICADYPTAYHALHHRAHIRPGETLFVHAAAGGAGSAATQVGLAHGCRVIATVGSEEKLAVCRELGAEPAISYAAEGVGECGSRSDRRRRGGRDLRSGWRPGRSREPALSRLAGPPAHASRPRTSSSARARASRSRKDASLPVASTIACAQWDSRSGCWS